MLDYFLSRCISNKMLKYCENVLHQSPKMYNAKVDFNFHIEDPLCTHNGIVTKRLLKIL